MERHMELSNEILIITDKIKRLESNRTALKNEWLKESLREFGLKPGDKVESEGATFIVDKRYESGFGRWIVGRKIKKDGQPSIKSTTIYTWTK